MYAIPPLSAAPDTPPRRDDRRRAPLMTHAWGALCLAAGLALAHAPAQALQPGEALGLQGRTLAGVPFNLAALRGKVVLVLFWSTHCAVCRDKMPELRANAHGWRGKPFELVSISVDRRLQDATDYDKLVAAMVPPDQRFPVLWSGDSTYQISAERPGGLPAAWLLDKSGRLVEQYTGRIPAEAWDKIADLL